jgi:hypothetical protein
LQSNGGKLRGNGGATNAMNCLLGRLVHLEETSPAVEVVFDDSRSSAPLSWKLPLATFQRSLRILRKAIPQLDQR